MSSVESVTALGALKGPAQAAVTFDEFNLDVDIRYDGELMEFPSRPPSEAVFSAADGKGVASLSGFFIRQYADRVNADTDNGRCRVRLHFDH